MLKWLRQHWSDWLGDRSLEVAVRSELRRAGYAVHAAQIRRHRLVAIERPGWVQVHRFEVETRDAAGNALTLLGALRDDGRRERPAVLLTTNPAERSRQLDTWCEGLIRRG